MGRLFRLFRWALLAALLFGPGCRTDSPSPAVNQPPMAAFSAVPDSGAAPLRVAFDAAASGDADGRIVSYAWNFGDGETGAGETASHVFAAGGDYTVTLTVVDDDGASAGASHAIHVAPGDSRRPWPATTRGVHVFNDQLGEDLSDAQASFVASHYAGVQKITRRAADRLRALNPGFLVLHYRLGPGLGYRSAGEACRPTGEWIRLISGDEWVPEWPGAGAVAEDWFFHWPENGSSRVYSCAYGWYLMELNDGGWRNYWRDQVIEQMQANHDDGVFMDSLSVPNYLGAGDFDPRLPDVDEVFENAWSERIVDWLAWLKAQFAGRFYLVPNVGSWITSRDVTDYGAADGVMVEGFALESDQGPLAFDDFRLQMNRVLAAGQRGQAVIAQTYVSGDQERMYALGCYLLVKSDRTYLNIDVGFEPEWWAEYDVPIGAPRSGAAPNIDALDADRDRIYRRDFDNGFVLVNPTNPWDGSGVTRAVSLGGVYDLAVCSGGGLDASGVPRGVLTYRRVDRVTLPPFSAAVLLEANR